MVRTRFLSTMGLLAVLVAGPAMAKDCNAVLRDLLAVHKAGGTKAVADEINKPGGEIEKLQRIVILYDTEGTAVAFSPDHAMAGMNMIDMQSLNGIYMVREWIKMVPKGSATMENVEWADPKTGQVVKTRGFATPLLEDKKHFIVCTENM